MRRYNLNRRISVAWKPIPSKFETGFMRNISVIIAATLLTISSCKKDDVTSNQLEIDTGCIGRIYIPVNAHAISSSEKIIVDNLFQSNGIVNQNYRFYRFLEDSFQTYYPPYSRIDEKQILADHYTNGLRIFNGNVLFLFFNDATHYVGGDTSITIALDTIPSLQLGQVRKLFIEDAERFEQLGYHFKDTCLRAEFGYYRQQESNNDVKVYKAWIIKPNYNDYPYCVHKDSDGALIGYDNGIRYFK